MSDDRPWSGGGRWMDAAGLSNNDDVLMLEAADELERLRYNERDLTANARIHAEIIAAKDAELVAVRAALAELQELFLAHREVMHELWPRAVAQGVSFKLSRRYDQLDKATIAAVAAGVLNREGWCETCQMTVAANHAHDDTCGHCSGGPVVNSDCPIHGAAGVLTKDSDT